ncbi:MAG: glycosyltransferase family 2 protein [Erysipelotrichales bacterium]|nr:glycosyltransferase family 2 protein [Erysipelotrichales bacterium]
MSKKISVIVPMWNVENYVGDCIESILSQTYQGFEIILIDDGSTDNTLKICEKYSEKDSRIRLFHKSHEGVSSARNFGLDHSNCDYCMFVDSDDKLLPKAIELLVNLMEKNNCQFVSSDEKVKSLGMETIDIRHETEKFLKYIHSSAYGVHKKLYNLTIIQNNKIRFDENLKCSEDALFNRVYFKYIEKIYLTSEIVYLYNTNNPNSLSKKGYIDFAYYFIKKLNALESLCDEIGVSEQRKKEFINERAIHGFKISMRHYFTRFSNTNNVNETFLKQRISYCYNLFMPFITDCDNLPKRYKKWYEKYIKRFDINVFYKKFKREMKLCEFKSFCRKLIKI